MNFEREALDNVYRLLEEERFMEAIEIYLHNDLGIKSSSEELV
ncbi:hypothetical protein [Leptobacterium flavescens]|nr:hypothetical protein [Leptobacterium flavescens]